jgi:hypothetical protein
MFDDGAVEHNARPSLLEIDSGPSPQRTQGSNQERILELQQRLASTKAETDRMRGQVSDISSDGAFQQAHGPNHNMQTPQRQGPAMEYQVQSLQKELDSAHKMHEVQLQRQASEVQELKVTLQTLLQEKQKGGGCWFC